MKPPRTFTLKDQASATIAYGSACRQSGAPRVGQMAGSAASAYSRDAERPAAAKPRNAEAGFTPAKQTHRKLETQYVPFGPAGEVLPEDGFEELDATREWLRHVEAGRVG